MIRLLLYYKIHLRVKKNTLSTMIHSPIHKNQKNEQI